MGNVRSNSASCETRRRLMESAGEVFAEQGFHNATIRQICERAGANVAAVNYHFRDKAELYDAVLHYAHCAAEAEYAGSRPSPDLRAEERLTIFIRTLMLRMLDEGRPAWHGKLMSREMTEPTAALDSLVEDIFLPSFREVRSIVGELLGPHATPEDIDSGCNSVFGQCLFFKHCKPLLLRMESNLRYDKQGIESMAAQVTRFLLLGLKGYRQELESPSEQKQVTHDAGAAE